jgi:hypothetical protein
MPAKPVSRLSQPGRWSTDSQSLRRISRRAAQHDDIAEPIGHAGEQSDLGNMDEVHLPERIDAKPYQPAGQGRRAERMADRVACEAGKGDDPERNVALADRMQREQIIADEIAVAGDHEYAGNDDAPGRLRFERGNHFADLDVTQQMIEHGCGADHYGNADRDADPAPAGAAADRLSK